jgi:hypothetical protein
MVKQSKDQILALLVLLSQIWYFSFFLWLFLGDFHAAGLALVFRTFLEVFRIHGTYLNHVLKPRFYLLVSNPKAPTVNFLEIFEPKVLDCSCSSLGSTMPGFH